jgi:hypothetical protein
MIPISVTEATYIGDYVIQCAFCNGVTQRIDMKPLLEYPAYAELRDENLFRQFRVEETICWSNGADISPEWLYNNGVNVE